MKSNITARAVKQVIAAVIAASCLGVVANVVMSLSAVSSASVAVSHNSSSGGNPWG